MTVSIHDCLMAIEKRAERIDDSKLIETFVDAKPLFSAISTQDNQVIFGRRGTGKTHLLKYLNDYVVKQGNVASYIDLRSVGSNGSIYNDREKSHAERATPLLLDVLGVLYDSLLAIALDLAEECDLSVLSPALDSFADAISKVEVVGTVETTAEATTSSTEQTGFELGGTAQASGLTGTAKLSDSSTAAASAKQSTKSSGTVRYYVRFGEVQSSLKNLVSLLAGRRVWLLLDEWSEIPIDIQPYLADLLRRCVLPLSHITVKIAAIEHRCNFSIRQEKEYLGIELGADAGGDVNLDDFMVFDNDAARATHFFAELLYKHYRASDGLDPTEGPQSAEDLIRELFTQQAAFEEFVRAVEGVPRDAVYLAATVCRKAHNRSVGVPDVRAAARDWYSRDKMSVLKSSPGAHDLLTWIIEEVIAHRRARAFLLLSTTRHPLVDSLFDSRLLHVLKKNVSSHDTPGKRYDVYKLDYGCYVDLITTSKAPKGLLPSEESSAGPTYIEVPPDDYRSIRQAILDVDKFDASRSASAAPEA